MAGPETDTRLPGEGQVIVNKHWTIPVITFDEAEAAFDAEKERGECGLCSWVGPWRYDFELALEDAKAHCFTEHPELYSRGQGRKSK